MIVVLGVVVGGMVVSMYLPIFDMMNAVQCRACASVDRHFAKPLSHTLPIRDRRFQTRHAKARRRNARESIRVDIRRRDDLPPARLLPANFFHALRPNRFRSACELLPRPAPPPTLNRLSCGAGIT
jgi:hypothetical protein